VFLDMVIDIHNPLSSKLTNTHNSIRNEMFLKFNLKDLQIKTFDGFIIDLLSSNSRKPKKKYMYRRCCCWNWEKPNYRSYKHICIKKNSYDILNLLAFTTSATLLIGGSTIHSLIGLSIDQNIDFQNF